MSNPSPIVSVIMPVYNSEKYLREAVESILSQTFRNFELIAVDDGSTDGSGSILAGYHQQDERIVILTHLKNEGIVSALNWGLKIASGKYIARMDADDVSLPERLEQQVRFLEAHPQVGILGSAAIFMDSQGQEIARLVQPGEDLAIRWTCLLANAFFHPTVMIRQAVLTEFNLGYQPGIQSGQDYALWVQMLEHTQGANLHQPLVRYRVYAESISSQYMQEQRENHDQISFASIQRLFPEIRLASAEHAMLVAAFTGNLSLSDYRHRPALARSYLELWRAFVIRHSGKPALKRLKHDTVVLAAKNGLFPPFQPGWLETMRCLFAADPLWVFYFAVKFLNMVHLKRLGIRLNRLRQVGL